MSAEHLTANLHAFGLKEQCVIPYPYPFSVGPRIVRNVVCSDGRQRSAYCSASGADTFFSIPARVYVNGRTVAGYVTRETLQGWSTETEGDPAAWKFCAYQYRANADALPRGVWKA